MTAEHEEKACSWMSDHASSLGMKMGGTELLLLSRVAKRRPIFGHLHVVLRNQPNAIG